MSMVIHYLGHSYGYASGKILMGTQFVEIGLLMPTCLNKRPYVD